jgi:type IV secretory pathway VirB10-like protein
MTTDIARLEQEIAAERAELLANLALLEDRARALTDWRRHVRKRPLAAVGVAAAGGLLLAMLTDRRPRAAADASTEGSNGAEGANGVHARPRSNPVMDRIISTLAVVAAERAFAALGLSMPPAADGPAPERDTRRTTRDREPRTSDRDREPRTSDREREPRASARERERRASARERERRASARDREPPAAGGDDR